MRYKWQPLVRADSFARRPELTKHTAAQLNVTEEEADRILDEDMAKCETWVNDLYQVQKRYHEHDVIHLNIRRRDGAAMIRDWRHFQLIKNQLMGPECEAVELYPPSPGSWTVVISTISMGARTRPTVFLLDGRNVM